jgi:HEAT repeat protein
MRFVATLLLILLLSGCGKPKETLAGGKPVSHWLEAVHDPDPRVRKTAVFKLGNIGASEIEVLPALSSALKDKDPAVRREAILALAKIGAEAKAAAPVLSEMSHHDHDVQVRKYAAAALERIKD